ncbi:small auxin-up RNA [Artemisia annua]|uniref:Small auxin-up RNA n=1 Tax=Artemisia annua TaxID=35608 RepID=A0A2U1QKS5_ARTAN|nr:small auxin-up RNA [Artemisia annua]
MAKKQVCGFRIRLKLVKVIKCAVHEKLTRPGYGKIKAITTFCKFGQSLKRSMKKLCFLRSGSNYVRLGQDNSCDEKPVPRGHLAVYFGEKEDDARRVLVPVIYFNHPFFGDLLRQAEKVYGFDHRGSIHVPCRISEFESVQSRICAAGGCGSYGSSWRRWL